MNYALHYERLIERARGRVLRGYSERHHVEPVCMGGGNEPENIVRLTPEEHYVAHQLLVKMHPGNVSLLWAAVCMTNGSEKQPRRNKLYGWLRRKFAESQSQAALGRRHTPETRAKMSRQQAGRKRRPHSAETKLKMSAASKGKRKSPEHRAALSAAKLGKKRGPNSPDVLQRRVEGILRAAAEGKFSYERSPEYRATQSMRMKQVWEKRRAGILPMPQNP